MSLPGFEAQSRQPVKLQARQLLFWNFFLDFLTKVKKWATEKSGTFSFFKRNFRNILSASKEKFDRSPLAKGKKFYQKFCLLTEKILKKLFLFIKFIEWEKFYLFPTR